MLQVHPPPWPRADRIASFALYRALLSQASALTSVPCQQRSELRNLIRRRFRRARGIINPVKRRLYFSAGYEALDYLDAAAAGDASRTAAVLSLLARAPAHAKTATPLAPPPTPAVPVPFPAAADGDRISLFDRPLPLSSLSGPRHVPVLFNASHIPVLRIKKPQPKSLTSYILSRIKLRQARYDRREMLVDSRVVAEREDAWDRIVRRSGKEGDGDGEGERGMGRMSSWGGEGGDEEGAGPREREGSWTVEIDRAIAEVDEVLERERRRNMEMSMKMQAVVDREREAAERERREAAEG